MLYEHVDRSRIAKIKLPDDLALAHFQNGGLCRQCCFTHGALQTCLHAMDHPGLWWSWIRAASSGLFSASQCIASDWLMLHSSASQVGSSSDSSRSRVAA